jgi:lysozyme
MIKHAVFYRLLILLLLALISVSCGQKETPGSEPAKEKETAKKEVLLDKGIDVSHFTGGVDWQKVKAAGYTFAFAKASEGVDLKDPAFDGFWPGMKEAGLVRGAYHFYVTEDDPKEQADFFIKNVTLEPGDFVPVVDIEVIHKGTQPGLVQRVKSFLEIIEKHYGARPIIYTGLNFWNKNLNDHFGSYPLWIAEYGVEDPVIPKGWKEWHIWQWKENANVPGVEKDVDLNVFNKKERDASQLLVK